MAVRLLDLRAGRHLQTENIHYFPHIVVEYVFMKVNLWSKVMLQWTSSPSINFCTDHVHKLQKNVFENKEHTEV
jgi:hypothetical protein